MTLDNEKQKKIIMQLMQSATFTGASLDELYEFKQLVEAAEINKPQKEGLRKV